MDCVELPSSDIINVVKTSLGCIFRVLFLYSHGGLGEVDVLNNPKPGVEESVCKISPCQIPFMRLPSR